MKRNALFKGVASGAGPALLLRSLILRSRRLAADAAPPGQKRIRHADLRWYAAICKLACGVTVHFELEYTCDTFELGYRCDENVDVEDFGASKQDSLSWRMLRSTLPRFGVATIVRSGLVFYLFRSIATAGIKWKFSHNKDGSKIHLRLLS